MILSMTGYGKSVVVYNGKKINVEIKSLNSKALDLSTRIAPLYREKEMEIRQAIQTKVIRGKVDFSIWIENRLRTWLRSARFRCRATGSFRCCACLM